MCTHQEQALGAGCVCVVLQRCGPEVGVNHMAGLLVQGSHPCCKLRCV